MKLLRSLLLVLMLGNVSFGNLNAQIDTLFWFAPPWVSPDHDGNVQIALRISSFTNTTTVRIQQPNATYDTTVVMAPNSLESITLDHIVGDLESRPADFVLNSGMKITSDENINVVYDFISDDITISPGATNNPETYSMKGQNGIGTEFVVPFQTLWNNQTLTNDRNGDGTIEQPYQYFSVVATEDNTTIYITPRADVVGGHPANVTYSVTLPLAGQVYTCQNLTQLTSVAGSSLSGSIVVADKPVSVTINDDSVNPSGGGGCFDLMGDQIVPTDVIGTEYIINEGRLNAGSNESIFIVASENFTTVTVNDGATSTQLMNQGDTYQYSINQPLTYVSADKPVYVVHMSGYGCELGMAIIPPTNCAGSDVVAFARSNDFRFLLNLLCESGDQGNFNLTVNGVPGPAILPTAFNPVPGTGGAWVGAQIEYTLAEIPVNASCLLTNSTGLFSMGVFNGNTNGGCLYHYMSSFNRKVITQAGPDTTLCNGEPSISLNGSVTGGTTTGIWTVLNGTGTLNTPTNLTTSYTPSPGDYTQGTLTFVLESTGNCDPVSDTMRVDFIQSPVVNAGLNDSYCKNNVGAVPINGAVSFATGASWSGGNGGAFGNPGSLSTTYTPSPTDLAADSVALIITSAGSLFACPNDQDTVVIHFTEAPQVSAGADLVVCSSQNLVTLNGSVTGETTSGVWTSSGTGSYTPSALNLTTDYLFSSADTTVGTVIMTLTSTNNGACLAEADSIQITFLNEPSVQITSADSVCSNLSVLNLDGIVSAGFTSAWTTNGAGSIISPGSVNTQYSISPIDATNGYIDIQLATNASICPAVTDSLRIFFIEPPIPDAGPDMEFCSNQAVQLNGSITGVVNSGTWSSLGVGNFDPGVNFLVTNYQPSALDLANGSVDLVLTAASVFGCPANTDALTITFREAPTADFDFNIACEGDNTTFNDQSTTTDGTIASWNWDFGNTNTSITQNPSHTYPGDGNYPTTLIVGGSNGCFDTLQQMVQVNPVPLANFSPTVACENTPITFNDQSFISGGSVTSWLYDFGGGVTSTDQNPTHTFTVSGNYPVIMTAASDLGCTDDTTMSLFIHPSPTANFTFSPNPALVLENVNFFDQSISNGTTSWLWDFGDGEGDNAQNPIHNFSDGGDYEIWLTITDTTGCQDTVSKIITIALPPVLPTGFTPNGDGENDVFIIRGGPFKDVDFKVYNNWGELIFTSNDAAVGWDGTYKGEQAPLGVYTWTFVVQLANDNVIKQSGDVTLIR